MQLRLWIYQAEVFNMVKSLDSKTLKEILAEIFKVDDEFIVPMAEGWYVPQVDKEKMRNETYVGFRIMSKKVASQKEVSLSQMQLCVKISFRIAFAGRDAEEFLNQVLFWKYNPSIRECFKNYNTTVDFDSASFFSYPAKELGDVWDVDFSAESIYVAENAEKNIVKDETAKKEQISSLIEEYIEKFVQDEVSFTAGEIRKWPAVDKVCENTDAPNICNAMKSVKQEFEIVGGKDGSTSFKVRYKHSKKGLLSESEDL